MELHLGSVHKYFGGVGWATGIFFDQNFLVPPPLFSIANFWAPPPWSVKLFDTPPRTINL